MYELPGVPLGPYTVRARDFQTGLVGQADGALSHDQLVSILEGANGWIVGHARVTRELMAALPTVSRTWAGARLMVYSPLSTGRKEPSGASKR
mgnify:CR=1 FL=1